MFETFSFSNTITSCACMCACMYGICILCMVRQFIYFGSSRHGSARLPMGHKEMCCCCFYKYNCRQRILVTCCTRSFASFPVLSVIERVKNKEGKGRKGGRSISCRLLIGFSIESTARGQYSSSYSSYRQVNNNHNNKKSK